MAQIPRAILFAKAMATSIFGLLASMRVIQEPLGALRRIAHIGDDAGLVVAEIELGSERQAFTLPPWLGREVTHDPRYQNSSLSQGSYHGPQEHHA
jgi:CYTH domain-containing protein